MRSRIIKCLALGATAFTALVAAPAIAQEADSADAADIVVTARRIEEKLQDVPISITVFNQDQLAARNIVNSTDLAAYTPSLSVNGRYGPDKSSFAIRGFSQDLNTLPTVGVYFADAVAPRLSSNITSGNGAGVGSMFDLQNVQVLKGPQGTLFGRNTTGGAILLVPQRPKDQLGGYVQGTIGSHDARRVEAVANLPLSDTFKVRLGIDRYSRDGYVLSRSGIGPKDFTNVNYFAARLGILADLTPDLENYALFTYARSDTNGSLGVMAFCNRGTVAGSTGSTAVTRAALCTQYDRQIAGNYGYYEGENNNPNPFVTSTTWQVINTTTLRASDSLTIKNIASYGQSDEKYSFSLSGDNIPFPFVNTYPGPRKGQGDQWTFSEELQFQGDSADSRLTWQAGGYAELSQPVRGQGGQEQYTAVFSTCTDVYAFKCNPLAFSPTIIIGSVSVARNVYYYRNFGLYAQATYKLTDQLSVTGGIRNTWDWQKEHADNIRVTTSSAGPVRFACSRAITPANPTADLLTSNVCNRTFVEKSSEPTWLVGLDFKPSEDILLYAKYARGYRGGGINEANFGAETWNPERVDNFELGIKASFDGAIRGTFNLAGFYNDFSDQQASVFIPQCTAALAGCTNPAPTGINGIQNIGKSKLKGIEADGMIKLGDNLQLDFGYAYLDAKVIGGSVPFCDNSRFICAQASFLTSGTILPFAPKNRVTLTGTYTLPLDESLGKISFGATFTHTDKQFSSHSNDTAFAAGAIPFNASISPATNLLNVSMNWKRIGGSPIDLALYATNVTKQKYYVAATNGLTTTGGEFLMLGEPRMYGMRLKFNFGD